MAKRKLLVRIIDPDGSNPITLQNADDIEVFRSINSPDEGGSFRLPSNDPKIKMIDYTKWWEIWESISNQRLNFGPIASIEEGDEQYSYSGPGRSQILQDLIMTKYTSYYPINRLLDDLRYENVAAEPKTVANVYGQTGQPAAADPKYYGLSKKTGPNAIDDTITFTVSDKRLPTFHTTDSYWSGTDRADGITFNLGYQETVSRVSLLFPWWGGYKRFTNRTYDFDLSYSNDESTFTNVVTKNPNYIVTADRYGGFYFYLHPSGQLDQYGFEPLAERLLDNTVDAQYWRVNITDTHAWYGNAVSETPAEDRWEDQCTPPPVHTITSGTGVILESSEPGSINSKSLSPENDCHASLVEAGIYKEIIGRDKISNLAYQQIDGSSNQVEYYHEPSGEELTRTKTVSTLDGYTLTKYEPGMFMKRIRFSWAGVGGSPFTKFFPTDKSNSMTSSNLAVVDQNNSLVYRSLLTSGTKDLILPAYTQFIMIKGATGVTIDVVYAWIGETNALSFGDTLSTSVHAGDTATLHFRGTSLKMYVTTPVGKRGATVDLSLSSDGGGSYTLLKEILIPDEVDGYKLFEITREDGLLVEGQSYEFKVENIDGGYVGLDSFAGYWEASWIEFNEDDERIFYNDNAGAWTQLYDGRFSAGTMTKTNEFGAHMQFGFTGDRVQIFMAKGTNFGKATIYISGQGNYGSNIVAIPGVGNSLVVDLGDDSGSPINHYIPRYLAFDSKDYWTDGMPWATYNIHVRLLEVETYTAKKNDITDGLFDQECIDCINDKDVKQNKFIYIDGVSAHCSSGISAKFNNQNHLEILKSVSDIIQHEWIVNEGGLDVEPRIGQDTDFIIKQGEQAVINMDFTQDVTNVASLVYGTGADIDGLPLFAIVEDKKNRQITGRTIARPADFRNIADYFSLIGAVRGDLLKRRTPDLRGTITYFGDLPVELGDSFFAVTKQLPDGRRVRVMKLTEAQSSSSGYSYQLECIKWPPTAE